MCSHYICYLRSASSIIDYNINRFINSFKSFQIFRKLFRWRNGSFFEFRLSISNIQFDFSHIVSAPKQDLDLVAIERELHPPSVKPRSISYRTKESRKTTTYSFLQSSKRTPRTTREASSTHTSEGWMNLRRMLRSSSRNESSNGTSGA